MCAFFLEKISINQFFLVFFGFNMFEFVPFFWVKTCLAAHRFDLGISGILSFFLIKAFMASHTMEHQRP